MSLTKNTKKYLSLVKFSHTIFALPFAMMGLVWAIVTSSYSFNWWVFVFVIVCMVTARNAAMGFNRLVDCEFDKLNPRTAVREIPAGEISKLGAIIFIILNSICFVISASLINTLTMWLSPIALGVILGYSYMKRISWLCHFVIGLSLAIAPVAAYISVTGHFDTFPIILSLIVLTWVSSFDILYSLQDEVFDKHNSLHSIPVRFGRKWALVISALLHSGTILLVLLLGYLYQLNMIYWIGAIAFSTMLIAQHLIVTPNNISRVNIAFAMLNSLGSAVYTTLGIISMY